MHSDHSSKERLFEIIGSLRCSASASDSVKGRQYSIAVCIIVGGSALLVDVPGGPANVL